MKSAQLSTTSDRPVTRPVGLQSSTNYLVASSTENKDYTRTTARKQDYLMIDSGAQVCVCSPKHYPHIPTVPLASEHTPNLRTVTGDRMKCHGVKYVDYVIASRIRMTVRYYVCDGVQEPVISVSGLLVSGYSLHLSRQAWMQKRHSWACNLIPHRGLHYIAPRRTEHARDYVKWTTADESKLLSSLLWKDIRASTGWKS